MLIKYSKLSNYKIKKLLQRFCEDLTATQTTNLLNLYRNTVNRYYNFFRKKIVKYQKTINQEFFNGEIELDESYFGGRNKGKRGRSTSKVPVFGILKRNGKAYTQIIKNASRSQIRPILSRKELNPAV